MANSNWYQFRNFFDNVTKGSFRRMNVMARDHHDKLKAVAAIEPAVNDYYQYFLPYYNHFIDVYSKYHSIKGFSKGYTMRVENKFIDLIQKIKTWDIKIQNYYMAETPEYAIILPNRRSPFQIGSYESRIAQLHTLIKTLESFPDLSDVKLEVEAFYTEINKLRTEQQGKEIMESELSDLLEKARIDLAQAMHGVFGGLLFIYCKDTMRLENFYERQYFEANSYNNNTSAMTTYVIPGNNRLVLFNGEVTINSKFVIQNTSEAPLEFYCSESNDVAPPIDALRLMSNEKGEFLLAELGNGAPERELRMLIVSNPTGLNGSFKISKIEINSEID